MKNFCIAFERIADEKYQRRVITQGYATQVALDMYNTKPKILCWSFWNKRVSKFQPKPHAMQAD